MNRYIYGTGSMGWEPEPTFTHLQRVRNEITKALYGEPADLALVAQFLDEIAVHGFPPGGGESGQPEGQGR